ncbi:DUF397 domain-containing protein [Streptomyces sp. NPDC058257]|uniref:DUF397 domain-containing protein n=1 Tax=Streptomyces sp. NPDC058257 TaxID=3346409 RepID=UPI0036E53E5D
MGTLTNGTTTIPYQHDTAPGLDWRKAGRTDLDPILKDCVILADAGIATGHPHAGIPDGTRLIAISDDKDPKSAVLLMSRVEISKFFDGVITGEFNEFRASEDELRAATVAAG